MEKRPFLFFLLVSLGCHGFFFIFLLNSAVWNLVKKDMTIATPVSIRVDMVGLPDWPSKKEMKKEKKKKPVFISETKRTKQKKKKSKKTAKKSQSLKKKEMAGAQDKSNPLSGSKKTINKGNQLNEGGAEKGKNTLDLQQVSEINNYFTVVEEQIKSHWNLPKYLTDIDLTDEIEIKINDRGEIVYKQIVVSSGNDLFDSLVLKAMERAAPYPPPPASVQALIKDGIIFKLSSKN